MAILDALCFMLNILVDTLSEDETNTLVDFLVKRKARMQVKSLTP